MKPGSVGDPDMYLGAKLRPMTLPNQVVAWGMSASKYVQEATKNVEQFLMKKFDGRKLAKKASAPFLRDYDPITDTTKELDHELASYYQSQIGILRWMVELGRIDMITEVSLLASHIALPREGHLEAVFHIFAYLKNKHNARMVFDPTYRNIDQSKFIRCDWKEFYGNIKELIPPDAPVPLGKEVDIIMYCDSDFAGDKMTRRSQNGYIIYINMAPIAWLSKRQPTIETSVFGAEFVALKVGIDALRGLRYKLRMMGIPISG